MLMNTEKSYCMHYFKGYAYYMHIESLSYLSETFLTYLQELTNKLYKLW